MIAIYCRVSTQNQVEEGYSLETQEELCRKRAQEMGYSSSDIKVYAEEGRSGEDIDRPKMNELREDAAVGMIHKVIITDPDRLTRDLTDKLIVCKEWDRQGIEVIFIDTEYENTPEGQMFFNMRSVFAQFELAQIRKRTIRGRLRAVEKDNKIMPMRSAPYGYDLRDGKLLINKQESSFVKKIYEWYLQGQTLRQIGDNLYREGAIPKRAESKNFSASSIRRILTSQIYLGKYIYNKRQTKKIYGEKTASGNQRKTYSIRDESDWITVDVPAIIDKEIFKLAQIQRKQNKKKGGNVKFNYLFKGKIRCKNCGRIWECTTYNGREDKQTGEKKKYAVYRCPNLNPKRYGDRINKCESQTIRVNLLDEYVFNMIKETLSIREVFETAIRAETEDKEHSLDYQIDELQRQLQRNENERNRVKRMYVVAQVITEDEMLRDMNKTNEDISKIKQDIEKLMNRKKHLESSSLTDEQINLIINNIKKMFEDDAMKFEEKRHLLDLLIEEITIDARENPIGIKIKGPLDAIASCLQSEKV